jgi:hypothetical protein
MPSDPALRTANLTPPPGVPGPLIPLWARPALVFAGAEAQVIVASWLPATAQGGRPPRSPSALSESGCRFHRVWAKRTRSEDRNRNLAFVRPLDNYKNQLAPSEQNRKLAPGAHSEDFRQRQTVVPTQPSFPASHP